MQQNHQTQNMGKFFVGEFLRESPTLQIILLGIFSKCTFVRKFISMNRQIDLRFLAEWFTCIRVNTLPPLLQTDSEWVQWSLWESWRTNFAARKSVVCAWGLYQVGHRDMAQNVTVTLAQCGIYTSLICHRHVVSKSQLHLLNVTDTLAEKSQLTYSKSHLNS